MRTRPTAPGLPAALSTTLAIAACIYLAVLPVSGTFVRSVAFAAAAICACAVVATRMSGGERIRPPDRLVAWTIALWSAWSCASVAWSIDPRYSLSELRSEIAWGLLTMFIFYVASQRTFIWRALVATAVGTGAALGLLSWVLYLTLDPSGPRHLFSRFHVGVGAYSTFIVVMLPFVPLLLLPGNRGFGGRRGARWIAAGLAALALSSARLTENRMIWVALAAAIVACAPIAAWRWRYLRSPDAARWLALVGFSLALMTWLFASTLEERIRITAAAAMPAWQFLAEDPRLSLWSYLFQRISERPWAGYGFGKSILQDQLRFALHDPLLSHAHNIFVSQWLQTGIIGLAAFVLLLAVLIRRYARFLRSRDDTCALLGLVGIALVTAFCVKGLTDDFMHRSPGKEFWALNAMLLGFGTRLESRMGRKESDAGSVSVGAARAAAPGRSPRSTQRKSA